MIFEKVFFIVFFPSFIVQVFVVKTNAYLQRASITLKCWITYSQ